MKVSDDMKNSIEHYQQYHQKQVVDLILGIQVEEFSIPITLDDQPDLQSIETFYQKGRGNFWVALDGNRVVGTIALIDIGGGDGVLRKMFVDKNYRGKDRGVAFDLLSKLLSSARLSDMRTIFLGTTEKYLAAHRFYEKYGFREILELELPAHFPRMAVDRKFYTLSIC